MRRVLHSMAVAALLGCSLAAQAQRFFVVYPNGKRRACEDIKADAAGNLSMKDGASTLNLKRGQYRYVISPKPENVENLERAYSTGNHKAVLANAGKLFDTYKFLGWGGQIVSIEAMSKLATGDAAGALKSVQMASSPELVGPHVDAVNKAKISALIALDRGGEAVPALQKLKASKDENLAAFAFLADGQILEKEGRQQEAVLAYLKTVLLFKDGVVDDEKRQARKRLAAILDELGDPRAKDFR